MASSRLSILESVVETREETEIDYGNCQPFSILNLYLWDSWESILDKNLFDVQCSVIFYVSFPFRGYNFSLSKKDPNLFENT